MINTKAEIISNTLLKNNIYELRLEIKNMPAVNCGQFAMVDCGSEDGITLKRPISIHSFEKNTVTLLYQAVGKGTKALSKFPKSKKIDIIIPCGNGFDVKNYKKIALMGGGLGVFPLYSVIKQHPRLEYYAYLGCKDKNGFVCLDKFQSSCKRVVIATDDGSLGSKGVITDKLNFAGVDAVFACGPKPMLKALKDKVKGIQTPVYVSLEERMGCGFGACLTCACQTMDGNKRVCVDGPVFDINEVVL
ncbi:MAG: dihydroorotate dehydrogenase electron transfer subunit [Christensenellales bacterium]|jgi:dihydroorotate dehydrogenase electron transfer subunit|nr:dihydroorotate dehydrogenase electron transfer subunit [Clostridiales bacterium]